MHYVMMNFQDVVCLIFFSIVLLQQIFLLIHERLYLYLLRQSHLQLLPFGLEPFHP
jgi:hypothetical protein